MARRGAHVLTVATRRDALRGDRGSVTRRLRHVVATPSGDPGPPAPPSSGDDSSVTNDVDDAIRIATQRTQAAQEAVAAELEAEFLPPVPVVEEVARRAEDLDQLAEQAADEIARNEPE